MPNSHPSYHELLATGIFSTEENCCQYIMCELFYRFWVAVTDLVMYSYHIVLTYLQFYRFPESCISLTNQCGFHQNYGKIEPKV